MVQKTLESRFLKGHRACTFEEPMHPPVHVRDCVTSGEGHMLCQHWGTSLSPSGFWSGGAQPWGQSEEAEAPAGPLERRGKAPSSGRTVCRPIDVPQVPIHLAELILGSYPTQVLPQFSNDVTLETMTESIDEIALD